MDERKRILKLVEDGTISADEAINLLEALSKQKESAQTTQQEQLPLRRRRPGKQPCTEPAAEPESSSCFHSSIKILCW